MLPLGLGGNTGNALWRQQRRSCIFYSSHRLAYYDPSRRCDDRGDREGARRLNIHSRSRWSFTGLTMRRVSPLHSSGRSDFNSERKAN